VKKPLLISACLLGENCKYSGGNNYVPAVESLKARYELLPVCPEQDGGLPTPRPPAERQEDGRVVNRLGTDVTKEYRRGAELALELALREGCALAVLKAKSPSCGNCRIYDGSFTGTLKPGKGVTAELLEQSGIRVLNEAELDQLLYG